MHEETFNSLEMEAHYPPAACKRQCSSVLFPPVCLVRPHKRLNWSHMTPLSSGDVIGWIFKKEALIGWLQAEKGKMVHCQAHPVLLFVRYEEAGISSAGDTKEKGLDIIYTF